MSKREEPQKEQQAWMIALKTKTGWRYKKWLHSMLKTLQYQESYYYNELSRLEKEKAERGKND